MYLILSLIYRSTSQSSIPGEGIVPNVLVFLTILRGAHLDITFVSHSPYTVRNLDRRGKQTSR